MRSTDHNLNNPMEVKTIGIYPSVDCSKLSEVVRVTMEEYELIQTKDPTVIYIINDSPSHKVYYGETLVEDKKSERIYLIGPADKFGEYALYLNEPNGINDNLIKICRYSDPQSAIDDLNKFNRVGSHQQINLQLYSVISQYITKDISINDMLIGIISLYRYRDSIKLQVLLSILQAYSIPTGCRDLPTILKNDINGLKKLYSKYPLIGFYASLYDLVVSYNFFKAREFQGDPDNLNLSKVIEKIIYIMGNTI